MPQHNEINRLGGPLCGFRVIEFAGLGACPFAAMMLADMGADVIRIDRRGGGALMLSGDPRRDVLSRGRRSIQIDLKQEAGVALALRLVVTADALLEGYRPGVMERLGLGPTVCLTRHPRLVYCRVTGWGQTGPLAPRAGHDINYIAVAGALGAIRDGSGRPVPPINYLADFGGGGMLAAFGTVCAILEAQRSGRGQVVDAAMTDGVALLGSLIYGLRALGFWPGAPGENLLDGGAPFYDVYQCADERWLAVGPLEPKFFETFILTLGLAEEFATAQTAPDVWPRLKARLKDLFRTKPAREWEALFAATDGCVSEILDHWEAPAHPHNRARKTFFTDGEGTLQPAPAPRFDRTPGAVHRLPPRPGEHSREILEELGCSPNEIDELIKLGAVAQS